MAKVSLRLTIDIQAESENIINMSEMLDDICEEIIPKEASYQATLENLLTGSIVEQCARTARHNGRRVPILREEG